MQGCGVRIVAVAVAATHHQHSSTSAAPPQRSMRLPQPWPSQRTRPRFGDGGRADEDRPECVIGAAAARQAGRRRQLRLKRVDLACVQRGTVERGLRDGREGCGQGPQRSPSKQQGTAGGAPTRSPGPAAHLRAEEVALHHHIQPAQQRLPALLHACERSQEEAPERGFRRCRMGGMGWQLGGKQLPVRPPAAAPTAWLAAPRLAMRPCRPGGPGGAHPRRGWQGR